MEILAQSSTAFALTHNFQGTQILGASRGRLSDSVASCYRGHAVPSRLSDAKMHRAVFTGDSKALLAIVLSFSQKAGRT